MTSTSSSVYIIFRACTAAIIVLCACTLGALAQMNIQQGFKTKPLGNDTLCFRYVLHKADTLVYHIEALDSIRIDGFPSMTKHRLEEWFVVCDSVDSNNHAWTRQYLTRIRETQRTATDTVIRQTSPWMRRQSFRVIDTLGNSIYAWSDTTRGSATAPGGPFAPLLFPRLQQSCGRQNESWYFQDTILGVEGGYPEAVTKTTTLWRVMDNETVGKFRYKQVQHTTTANGSFDVQGDGTDMTLAATINCFGKLSMRYGMDAPYHIFTLSENKLTFERPNGVVRTGMHKYWQDAQLVRMYSGSTGKHLGPFEVSPFDAKPAKTSKNKRKSGK